MTPAGYLYLFAVTFIFLWVLFVGMSTKAGLSDLFLAMGFRSRMETLPARQLIEERSRAQRNTLRMGKIAFVVAAIIVVSLWLGETRAD